MKKSSQDFFQTIGEFPHNIGIYLTYTLDNEVIDKLTEFATGTKLILHDFKQGKTIDDNDNSTIVYLPIKTLNPNDKNCFHSKLALLKAENGAKFIVGSANLSVDSFALHEPNIAFEMELDFKSSTDVFIYNQILNFFEQLSGKSNREKSQLLVDNGILDKTIELLQYNELPKAEGDIQFVYTTESESIFDLLKKYLETNRKGQKVKSIKIVTPFVSDNYSRIDEFKAISNDISVYLRNGAKTTPFEKHQFKIFQPSPTYKRRKRFHAKLILVEFNSDAVLYIGSANFTEQGFFKTLNESANQECGTILKVSATEMHEWFNESLWKQLSESEIKDNPETDGCVEYFDSVGKTYAWAEKEGSKIYTYIFNPNKLSVTKTKGGNKINLLNVDDNFLFKTNELKEQNQKVHFFIGDEKISLPVFVLSEYISGLSEKGESIFDSFKGIYSVNPIELDAAIDKQKLSVSETTNIKITEPPKLEQFFYNVKQLVSNIQKKKYFTEYNEQEISDVLNGVMNLDDYFRKKTSNENSAKDLENEGRYMYLTLQLLKAFNSKTNTKNLKSICNKRRDELSGKLNIDKKKLNTFIKGWLTSKN